MYSCSLLRSRFLGCHAKRSPKQTAAHIRTTFLSYCVSGFCWWFLCGLLNRPIIYQQSANGVRRLKNLSIIKQLLRKNVDVADQVSSVIMAEETPKKIVSESSICFACSSQC